MKAREREEMGRKREQKRERRSVGGLGERETEKRENIPKPAFSCFPQLRGYWCHTDK